MKQCEVEGCDAPCRSGAGRWCERHYTRWLRHGDPGIAVSLLDGVGRPPGEESERRTKHFWALIGAGIDFDVAAERARVKEKRALKLLSSSEGRQIIAHLVNAQAKAAA